MKKKLLALLLSGTMLAGMLTGCSSAEDSAEGASVKETTQAAEEKAQAAEETAEAAEESGEKVVITMVTTLGNETRDQLMKDLVEASCDNIELEIITPPSDQAGEKIVAMLQAHEDIDIVEDGLDRHYIENGWIADLTDYVAEWDEYETILPSLKDRQASFDGKVYGLYYGRYERCLFYRADWLKEAGIEVPTTWNELYDAAVALTDPSQNRYGYAMRGNVNGGDYMQMLLQASLSSELMDLATPYITKEGKSIYEYPEAIEACEFWIDLYNNASNPDSLAWGYPESVEAFYSGTAAFLINDAEVIATCEQYMEDGTWGTAPLPVHDETGESWFPQGGAHFCITGFSEHKDEAFEVLKVICGQEGNMELSKINGTLPVHTTAAQDPFFGEGYYAAYATMGADPNYKGFSEAAEYAFATEEELSIIDGFWKEKDALFQELLLGELSPEDYCADRASYYAWAHDSEWVAERFGLD
ncbi:MAG: sugar ABC transporter substrate-binding protein [Lachnospiraceae bacterium]|nr:sugar ABC transporter substrate-binding protein [Lachnospiraceae bacterium]